MKALIPQIDASKAVTTPDEVFREIYVNTVTAVLRKESSRQLSAVDVVVTELGVAYDKEINRVFHLRQAAAVKYILAVVGIENEIAIFYPANFIHVRTFNECRVVTAEIH